MLPFLRMDVRVLVGGLCFEWLNENVVKGKTHTMLGSPNNPGIMALTLEDLFENIENNHRDAKSESNYRVGLRF